ncbi:MAG: AMP-binding protein [Betaproteobacteria bacterium]|nr:AMP-binding protein [Betaproteobacteria bacterium]
MNTAGFLAATARSFGEARAVSVGDRLIHTYAQLHERVARLAGGLRRHPAVAAGDRIALVMKNSAPYFELMWAAWHAGLCVVPVNAKLHPREVAFILENCGARLCFVSPDLGMDFTAMGGQPPALAALISVDDDAYRALCRADPLPMQAVAEHDPAWLFYTSGTTGRPKGATLTHRNLRAMALRYYADIDSVSTEDTMLHAAPLSHGGGLYSLPQIARGGHQVVPESQGFDPSEMVDLIGRYRQVSFFGAPTIVMRIVNHPSAARLRAEHMKTLFYGGAPMYLEDLRRAMTVFPGSLLQIYGQGETPNTITSVSKAMHSDSAHPRHAERLSSVGIARTGVQVRVVDPDDRDLPPGEIGEVICRSEVTMAGYWNNPQASEAALRDGWLRTGDLGSFDADGFLTLKDRAKDLIISGGTNIYPREVEEVLLLHPALAEVSVVGRHHADWGEEVVAFLVERPGQRVSDAELDALVVAHIARFKRPKAYFRLEALPKNNYGKVLKTELRARLAGAQR